MSDDIEYRTDYPKEPIDGDNPYYCCAHCGISDPEINGRIEGHAAWCQWRREVNVHDEIESLRRERDRLREALIAFMKQAEFKEAVQGGMGHLREAHTIGNRALKGEIG